MTKPSCADCAFSEKTEDDLIFCHRYPPQLQIAGESPENVYFASVFPQVSPDMYCGEFKPGMMQ